MFTCCSDVKNASNYFENLPLCGPHDNPLQFICLQPRCRVKSLLCVDCLTEHKEHPWQTLQNFFTPDIKQMLQTGNSKESVRIEQADSIIVKLFVTFRENVGEQISRLEGKITKKLEVINETNRIVMRGGKQLSQQSVTELLFALQRGKSVEWVQNLKTFLESAIEEAVKTVDNIVDDLEAAMGTDWEERTHLQNQLVLKQLKQHLHYHKEKDPNYFKFTPQLKHPGIHLSEDELEAIFKKNLPSRPVAIASNPIHEKHLRFAFQIKKLQKTAFIFAATTIFVGVCNPTTVKSVGMRRISEVGKGAYMIGSSGWSYHHKNPKYDRKNVVGFGFSEGEKINIELDLEQGQIHFSKEGKIFKSKFSMPLDLNPKQILQLKPCVSFDGDEGAIVRILNL